MTRFFVLPSQIVGGIATLNADDSHHLRVVLHAEPGQKIAVLDGAGLEYEGILLEVGKSRALARLGAPFSPETEPQTRITIAQALPKVGEKMEQVLQRGTEIGAAGFRVFESARSLTHLTGERQAKRLTRWQAIVKTAAEQSHRAKLPTLEIRGGLSDVLASADGFDWALLAYEGERDVSLRAAMEARRPSPQTVLVIVGPEGGFSDGEVQAARQASIPTVSLGPRIFRTETAPLVLLSQLLFAWELPSVR